jgi:hypothetical protein
MSDRGAKPLVHSCWGLLLRKSIKTLANCRNACGDYLRSANKANNRRMKSGENNCIWQQPDWPRWRYDLTVLVGPMTEVSRVQGLLLGRLPTSAWDCGSRPASRR